MKISRIQCKTLQPFRGLQSDQGSVLGQMRRNLGMIIYWLVLALLLVPITNLLNEGLGLFTLGMIVATAVRDIRYFTRSTAVWPVVEEVFDWQRIDELLDP